MRANHFTLALVAALVACTPRVSVPVREIPNASRCACRVLCAPDGYWWSLDWMPSADMRNAGVPDGGHCTCVGQAKRLEELR